MASKLELELEKENKALKDKIEKLEMELTKGKIFDLEKGETVRFKKGNEEYRAKLNNNGNVSIVVDGSLFVSPVATNTVALLQTVK